MTKPKPVVVRPAEDRWHKTDRFTGIQYPRFKSKPEGPFEQSMVVCVCGAWWNDHRFSDGACPKSLT